VQLDVSIVNVALVSLARELRAGTAGVAWIVDAYAIAFACMLIAGGSLGDRIGAKRTFAGAFAIFGIASLGCALAPNLGILVAMRAVQGIGAAALVPCSLALIAHAARDDANERARAIAFWTAAGSVALALGPVAGGILLATTGWRGIFLINLPICVAAIWLTGRWVAETEPRAGRFDAPGQILAVVTLLATTAAIIEGGALGFGALVVRISLVTALAGGAAFALVEARSSDPMMPLGFFRNATFTAAVLTGLAINASLYGTLFGLGLYLQRERGYSPLDVGFAFVPFAVMLGIANVSAGRLVAKLGPRLPLIGGLLLALAGFALLLVCGATTPYVALLPGLVVIPCGIGTAVPAMTSALLGTVPRERSGVASGVLNTVRQAAGALGVATGAALIARFGLVAGMHDVTLLWLFATSLAIGVAIFGIARQVPGAVAG
jgi:DHA2 family methylenomycin A resistance protein-like MFS transporter